MNYIILLLAAISFNTFGSESPKMASYSIVSDKVDDDLHLHEARISFNIRKYDASQSESILYSINDVEKTVDTKDLITIEENISPGIYKFEFVLALNYYEIFINNLVVLPQHHVVVQLNFSRSDENIMMKKPVIYLYPQEETRIEIELKTIGDLTFTYPEYNDGWSVTVDSLGTITSNNETYNYLFWESEQSFSESIVDRKRGAIVNKNNLVSYLEKSLTTFGFNSKEKADFITYWIPKMKDATNLYLYFVFNEACDEFATLNIRPEPARIARFYVLWAETETNCDEFGIIPQEIPSFSRDGFTVLEWGGAEIDARRKTID